MEVILLIILIYIAYRTILIFIEGKRLGKDTLIAFTGGLGTGKTLLGVDTAVRRYKYSIIRYYFRKIFFFKKEDKPILISNIPILLKKGTKTRDAVYSYKLKAGHLLMINQVPNNAVIFIDEIGHIVDQYSHSNPLIMIYVKEFIRWYRHYTKGGSLIITDQSSDEVNVAVRRRLNVVHNLENFRKRLLGLAYMVDTTPLMQTDGVITQMKTNEDKEYFVRFFPFTRRYDTYAFSDNYTPLQKFSI
ncbi:MAG TPA: hypothetical protein PLP51_01075 [Acholeplasmataceae bacterium]|nr:hypothetical protein [Acholeplasmataceae bacterium]